MTKRRKFIITTFLLLAGFIGINFLDNQFRFYAIGGLSVLTVLFFVWSLSEGLGLNMTVLALVLPLYFTAGVGVFWFLLPVNILARIPVLIFYAAGIYSLLLTNNVFTVTALRSIALFRAARGVGFVLSLVSAFLTYDAVLSLKLPIYFAPVISGLLSFPLFLQGLWAVNPDKNFSGDIFLFSAVFSSVIFEIALVLYFWPVTVVVGSLFLTESVYIMLGLGQAKLEDRLFSQTVREYLAVGLLVFIGTFLATHWG